MLRVGSYIIFTSVILISLSVGLRGPVAAQSENTPAHFVEVYRGRDLNAPLNPKSGGIDALYTARFPVPVEFSKGGRRDRAVDCREWVERTRQGFTETGLTFKYVTCLPILFLKLARPLNDLNKQRSTLSLDKIPGNVLPTNNTFVDSYRKFEEDGQSYLALVKRGLIRVKTIPSGYTIECLKIPACAGLTQNLKVIAVGSLGVQGSADILVRETDTASDDQNSSAIPTFIVMHTGSGRYSSSIFTLSCLSPSFIELATLQPIHCPKVPLSVLIAKRLP